MERKLENELPVKGKKYKRISSNSSLSYEEGRAYESEDNYRLNGVLWYNATMFSKDFVEVIEESRTLERKLENELSNKSLTLHDIDLMGKDVENKINEKIGVKHDQNKLPLFTIIFKQFPLAIQAVAKRALAGHNKYIETDADWQNFARAGEQDPDRYKNAGMRHMLEEGEDTEKGMEGTTHESAVVWNFLADLELKIRRDEKLSK